jgi:hypothetical protein
MTRHLATLRFIHRAQTHCQPRPGERKEGRERSRKREEEKKKKRGKGQGEKRREETQRSSGYRF